MLGYAMHLNALTPTMQFLLCVAIVIHGVAQRPRDYDTKEPAKPAGPPATAGGVELVGSVIEVYWPLDSR